MARNKLYEFTMRVVPAEGSELPAGAQGAYVPCYACAPDPQAALKQGVAAASGMGCRFDDLQGPVREIPAEQWGDYLRQVWPEHQSRFPTPDQLPARVEAGGVFLGPVAVFGAA